MMVTLFAQNILFRIKNSFSSITSEPISVHDVVAITSDNVDNTFSPLQTPVRSEGSFETSLPGAASITPLQKLKNVKQVPGKR